MTLPRWAVVAGVLLVGLVLGVAVAVGSSLSSLSPDRHGETAGFVQPSPSPLPSPSPTVNSPGVLGDSARLLTNGSNTVIALGSNLAVGSADGGHTWIVVRPPSNGSGLIVDPANPRHAITGGSGIQVTGDGVTWIPTVSPPPGKGPYQPLAISPVEANVWFVAHQSRLLVTRDGSATWTELNVPQLTTPVLVPGQSLGQFFLATGNRVFQLENYGQTITEKPALPQSSVVEIVAVGGSRAGLVARVAGQGAFLFDGKSWTSAGSQLNGPVAAGAAGTMLVGNGGAKLGLPARISYSTNGGATWLPAQGLPPDQTVEAIAGDPGSATFFAYCFGGDVYASADGGRSWGVLSRFLRSRPG